MIDRKTFDAEIQRAVKLMMFHCSEVHALTRDCDYIQERKIEILNHLIALGHKIPWRKRIQVYLGKYLYLKVNIHCSNCNQKFIISVGGNIWTFDKYPEQELVFPEEVLSCSSCIIKDII